MLAVGVFAVVFGIGAWCAIKGTDRRIETAVQKVQKEFCRNVSKLIQNEKKLRNMDHAFRLLIFVQALSSVKKMFNDDREGAGGRRLTPQERRARASVTGSIQDLQRAMQMDVNKILR